MASCGRSLLLSAFGDSSKAKSSVSIHQDPPLEGGGSFSRLFREFKAKGGLWAQLELWKELIFPIYCIGEKNWNELIEALAGIQTFVSSTVRSLMAGTLSRLPSCPQLQRRADT